VFLSDASSFFLCVSALWVAKVEESCREQYSSCVGLDTAGPLGCVIRRPGVRSLQPIPSSFRPSQKKPNQSKNDDTNSVKSHVPEVGWHPSARDVHDHRSLTLHVLHEGKFACLIVELTVDRSHLRSSHLMRWYLWVCARGS